MTPDDLAIRPAATREEAAAIAAAVHAHERGREADGTRPESGWTDRRWRLAARLESVGHAGAVRGLEDVTLWRVASRADP